MSLVLTVSPKEMNLQINFKAVYSSAPSILTVIIIVITIGGAVLYLQEKESYQFYFNRGGIIWYHLYYLKSC